MIRSAVIWVSGLLFMVSVSPLLAEEAVAGQGASLKSLAEIKQAIQKTQDELDQLRRSESEQSQSVGAPERSAAAQQAAKAEPQSAMKETSLRQSKPPVVVEIRKIQQKADRLAMRQGRASKAASSSSTLKAVVDLDDQRMRVYVNGDLEYTWKVSTARPGYVTPTGTYKAQWLARMHYSTKYDDAPMPYSVFFNEGYAVHGTNSISRLGRPASHGCVRLHPNNAKTLFNLVKKHGKRNVTIQVVGTSPAATRSYKDAESVRPVYDTDDSITQSSAPSDRPSARRSAGWEPFQIH